MSEAKHSPTPWLVENRTVYSLRDDARVNRLSFTVSVRTSHGAALDDPEEVATAAFIVQACNAHDDLVAALRDVLRSGAFGVLSRRKQNAISAALVKAGVRS